MDFAPAFPRPFSQREKGAAKQPDEGFLCLPPIIGAVTPPPSFRFAKRRPLPVEEG
jgi:hypothetical protein